MKTLSAVPRIRALYAVALAAFLCLVTASPAPAADSLQAVRDKGVLTVGVRTDTPPFGFIDRNSSKIVGLDVDLASAVADGLKVRLELRPVTPSDIVSSLLEGRVDLVAAAVPMTPDRNKLLDFSLSYFKASQRLLAKTGSVTTVEALSGKRIGVAQGTSAEKTVREKVPGAACVLYTDPVKAVEALRNGEIDALSASGTALYGCMSSLPKGEYEIGSVKLAEEGYRFAARKGDGRLIAFVNETLSGLDKTGEAKRIFDKWFRPDDGAEVAMTRASGAVTRTAAKPGRFVAVAFAGVFRNGTDVLILDMSANVVGTGKVAGVYEDEVYIDAPDLPEGLPLPGFSVQMNYSPDDAKKVAASQKSVLTLVKDESKKEAEQRSREIGQQAEREKKQREAYQEAITQQKMYLDYQYNDDLYRWYYFR